MTSAEIYATIDRIEQDEAGAELAVLVFDDGQQLVIPVNRLPHGCQAGTVLRLDLSPDFSATEERRQRVKQVQSRLFGERASKTSSQPREPE